MLEHEHGDHPNYQFPVDVEWIGPMDDAPFTWTDGEGKTESVTPAEFKNMAHETHALIYTDGVVAITLNECCYAMWHLTDGSVAAVLSGTNTASTGG